MEIGGVGGMEERPPMNKNSKIEVHLAGSLANSSITHGAGHSLLNNLLDLDGSKGGTLAVGLSGVGVSWLSVGHQLSIDIYLLLDRLQQGQRHQRGWE